MQVGVGLACMLEGLLPGHPGLLLQATQLTGGLIEPATGQRCILLGFAAVPVCFPVRDHQPMVAQSLAHTRAGRA